MSQSIVNFISIFSGLCGIVAFLLYFIAVPKSHKTISLLITSILIGLPLTLLFLQGSVWIFSIAIITYTISIILFSYFYGKTKAEQRNCLLDLLLVTNKRTSGQEWILENISKSKTEAINIDAYGVKLDSLYKVIKGSTYRSKLSQDLQINMRALVLESNCFGVKSRSLLEKNDKILKDVELMNEVWKKLVKEYKKHPTHSLKVKTFEFTPAFYIIRVNEKMLIGTYLAESGYENLSLHLTRNDGKTFNQFERYFEHIWTEYSKNIIATTKHSI